MPFNFSGGKPLLSSFMGQDTLKDPTKPWAFKGLMQSPLTRFGLGMLERGGGSGSFGQNVVGSLKGVQDQADEDEVRAYRQQQLEMMKKQNEWAMSQLKSFQDPNGFYNGGMGQSLPTGQQPLPGAMSDADRRFLMAPGGGPQVMMPQSRFRQGPRY